jgi:hypothetical protein
MIKICSNVAGRVTGLWAGKLRGGGFNPARLKNFPLSISFRPALGPAKTPIQGIMGALSQGVKQQGSEAFQSPPTSAEAKNIHSAIVIKV